MDKNVVVLWYFYEIWGYLMPLLQNHSKNKTKKQLVKKINYLLGFFTNFYFQLFAHQGSLIQKQH